MARGGSCLPKTGRVAQRAAEMAGPGPRSSRRLQAEARTAPPRARAKLALPSTFRPAQPLQTHPSLSPRPYTTAFTTTSRSKTYEAR